eukprot:363257-Chlamydomonas_euryale.AAC.1
MINYTAARIGCSARETTASGCIIHGGAGKGGRLCRLLPICKRHAVMTASARQGAARVCTGRQPSDCITRTCLCWSRQTCTPK